MFGVHYIVFLGLPDNVSPTAELVKLYYEMFFNSFQVSVVVCGLGGLGVSVRTYKYTSTHTHARTHTVAATLRLADVGPSRHLV